MFDDTPNSPMTPETSGQQNPIQPQEVYEEPEVEATAEETPEETPQPKQNKAAENIRELRRSKEKTERQLEQALSYIQQIQTQKAPDAPEEDLSYNLNPDDIAEGKHLSKLEKKILRLESAMQKNYQQSAQMAVEARIKATFPDFDKIVNMDTVRALADEEPELAASIDANPDLFKKASAAYKLIKKLGIAENHDYEPEKQKVQNNLNKPRPAVSVAPKSQSALTEANAFMSREMSESERTRLLKEIAEATKYR